MKRISKILTLAAMFALAIAAHASSHREALAILNEPCADNTDTYAWVSNGTHDKLYLIMDFNPLHEPGQGNQGLRACNGYRYEFHIGKGTSLKDEVVYRVEFTNTLKPEAAPEPDRSARRRQRAALAAHRRHRDDDGHAHRRRHRTTATSDDDATTVLGKNLPVLPNNHGPQTDRLDLRPRRVQGLRLGRSDQPRSRSLRSGRSSTVHPARCRTAAGSSPASSTIPISSTRRASSTWST